MLKRNCLQDKKKKRKAEIDKKRHTISQLIERDIKDQNTRKAAGESEQAIPSANFQVIALDQLDPNTFVFYATKELTSLFKDLTNSIQEFTKINNEYIQIKLQEEKMKNKKTKQTQPIEENKDDKNVNEEGLAIVNSGGQQLQEITLQGEVERTIKLIVETYPDKLKQEIQDRLLVSFELKKLSEFPYLQSKCYKVLPVTGQKIGQRWNKVNSFYQLF